MRIIRYDRPSLCLFSSYRSLSHPVPPFYPSESPPPGPPKILVRVRRAFVPQSNFFSLGRRFAHRGTKRRLSHSSSSGGNRLAREIRFAIRLRGTIGWDRDVRRWRKREVNAPTAGKKLPPIIVDERKIGEKYCRLPQRRGEKIISSV